MRFVRKQGNKDELSFSISDLSSISLVVRDLKVGLDCHGNPFLVANIAKYKNWPRWNLLLAVLIFFKIKNMSKL